MSHYSIKRVPASNYSCWPSSRWRLLFDAFLIRPPHARICGHNRTCLRGNTMNRLTTRTRLVLAALALLIPTLIVAGVILYEAFKRSQTQVTVTQFSTADVVSQSVFQMVDATEASLMQLAQQDAIRAIDQRPD